VKVQVEVEVDVNKVWEDVWGNDGNGFAYWVSAVRDSDNGVRGDRFSAWKRDESGKIAEDENGDWMPNPHDFAVYDGESGEWHDVTVEDLVNGWVKVRNAGLTHCGGHSLDEPDACVEDYYLQYAIFGELVFG
jgi:hypothetical protein